MNKMETQQIQKMIDEYQCKIENTLIRMKNCPNKFEKHELERELEYLKYCQTYWIDKL